MWPQGLRVLARQELENQEELTLTCLIQKFFPSRTSLCGGCVTELMREGQHTTTQPDRADNNTSPSSPTAAMVLKASWKMDDEFTCQGSTQALPKTRP